MSPSPTSSAQPDAATAAPAPGRTPGSSPGSSTGSSPGLSLPRRGATLAVVGVALGVLTSVGQGHLPHQLHDMANSSTTWSLAAFGLALLARRWWSAAAYAVAAFALLMLGYELASQVRVGHGMAVATWAFWMVLGAVAGPVLGMAAWWARRDPRRGRCFAVGVLGGLAIAEGIYGLTVVAWSTSPVWWTISLVLGVVSLVVQLARVRSAWLTVLTLVLAAAVGAAFLGVYLGSVALLPG